MSQFNIPVLKDFIFNKFKEADLEVEAINIEKAVGNIQWHPCYTFMVRFKKLPEDMYAGKYISFTIEALSTGCGLASVIGFRVSEKNKVHYKILFDIVRKIYARDGAGTIIATIGDQSREQMDPILLEFGFIKITTYANLRHGKNGRYQQSLYQRVTDFAETEDVKALNTYNCFGQEEEEVDDDDDEE